MQMTGVRGRTVLALAMVLAMGIGVSGCRGADDAATGNAVEHSAPAPAATRSAVPHTGNKDIDRQLAYAFKHWDDTSSNRYGNLGGSDCVNFTSQTLLARGWTMDADWWYSNTDGSMNYGSPWISSTAMMKYLQGRPDLATALTDQQRSKVRVGDIAQFDYDNSGDRDHTGVVSKVVKDGDSIKIYLVQHSKGDDYRSVDGMLESHEAGAKVYYWHLST